MLGQTISDLEAGDVFEPVEYVLTPFMAASTRTASRRTASGSIPRARRAAGRCARRP